MKGIEIKNELCLEYTQLLSVVHRNEVKYYHLRSVANFIYHIDKIEDEQTYLKVASSLRSYFNLIYVSNYIDKERSLELYYEHIGPIVKVYVKELKFTGYVAAKSIIYWVVILNTGIYLLFGFSGVWIFLIVNITLALISVDVYRKKIIKKVAGFMY